MIGVINLNAVLVDALAGIDITEGERNGLSNLINLSEDYTGALFTEAFGLGLTRSWGAAIMWSTLLIITFIFLIIYIKRMLMVCFLTIIAPLITVSYSIDKSDNNRSEVLNTWLKEYCYNVLIQPFHCITYLVFVGAAMNIMYTADSLNFGAIILAITCIICIFIGEKLIRMIFGFNKSSSIAQKLFTGAMVTNAISNVQRATKGASQEEEEEEPPTIMPSGRSTQEVVEQHKSENTQKQNITNKLDQEPKQVRAKKIANTNNTIKQKNDGTYANEAKAKRKTNRAMQLVNEIGSTQLRTIATATGYTAYKDYKDKRKERKNRKKIPKGAELFYIASEDYRRSVNPSMTDQQLMMRIQALRNSSYGELKNTHDIIFKLHITNAEKQMLSQGIDDPIQAMKESITNKGNKRLN